MERYCSTGQSPQRAVAPIEEEEVVPKERKDGMHPAASMDIFEMTKMSCP